MNTAFNLIYLAVIFGFLASVARTFPETAGGLIGRR